MPDQRSGQPNQWSGDQPTARWSSVQVPTGRDTLLWQVVVEIFRDSGKDLRGGAGVSIYHFPSFLRRSANFAIINLVLAVCACACAAVPSPPREVSEVRAALAHTGASPATGELRPLKILLVANRKDHGPNAHDYPRWQKRWSALLGGKTSGAAMTEASGATSTSSVAVNVYGPPADLSQGPPPGAANVNVETVKDWPTAEQFAGADVIVAYMGTGGIWNEAKLRDVKGFMERGGGFVSIHSAVIAEKPNALPLSELIGLAWEGGYTLFRHGGLDLKINATTHPICLGLPPQIHFTDETYWPLVGDASKVEVLATADETARGTDELQPQPMIWTSKYGKGRAFSCILGHYSWTFDDPYFRMLLLRGIAWAAGESPYRFDPLVLCGARVIDGTTSATIEKPKPAVEATTPDAADPNLLLWLDASDTKTVNLNEDAMVNSWRSKAQKKSCTVKVTSAHKRPIFIDDAVAGRPAVTFDGTDDVLRDIEFRESATEWTLFYVFAPRSNTGNGKFHTLIATNKPRENDYETGFNMDLGRSASPQFSAINLEGSKDFPGAVNLRTGSSPFDEMQVLTASTGDGRSQLWVNGAEEGDRPANDAVTAMDEVRIGARYCHNHEHGHLHAHVAEVLLYKSKLNDQQRAGLEAYLAKKHGLALRASASQPVDAWDYLPAYDWGETRKPLAAIDGEINEAGGNAKALAAAEARLLKVLMDKGSAPGARDFASRRLAFIGTTASVASLAALVADDSVSTMALFALESIPGEAADNALNELLGRIAGGKRIGVINALGNRKVEAAVDALVRILSDPDSNVRLAATTALGEIGGERATEALRSLGTNISRANDEIYIESLLKCAERFAAEGKQKEALALYEGLGLTNSVPAQAAGLAGIVKASGPEIERWLVRALNSGNPRLERVALLVAREVPGSEGTRIIVENMPRTSADMQVRLLDVLADRKDAVAKAAVRDALTTENMSIRVAGIKALGELGDASDIPRLLGVQRDESGDVAEAVKRSLSRLSGADVDAALLRALESADASSRLMLIEVLGQRSYAPAKPVLIARAADTDEEVRAAAMKALGEMMTADDVPTLLQMLLKPISKKDVSSVEKTLRRVHARIDAKNVAEKELWLQPILAALPRAEPGAKAALLRTLSRDGGPEALQAVKDATETRDAEFRNVAIRILCDWPMPAAADDLFAIAKTSQDETHRVLAMRGFLRLAGNGYVPPKQRLAMCKQGMQLAWDDEQRRLALGTMAHINTIEALQAVLPFLDQEAIRDEAAAAALTIGRNLLPWHRAEVADAADRVTKTTKNPQLVRGAEELRTKAKEEAN